MTIGERHPEPGAGGGAAGGAGGGFDGADSPTPEPQASIQVRKAKTSDVKVIRRLVDTYAVDRRLLSKATVALYEDIQEFVIAELVASDGSAVIAGCGALHVMWQDLAEVRTIATDPAYSGRGVGSAILTQLLANARKLDIERVFVLTFETEFFGRFGFEELDGSPVSPKVYRQLLQSYDEGVAEFLDLDRVKPNTLGNTRMLKVL